jgi:hypothetical protein
VLELKEHGSRRRLELLTPDLRGRKLQASNFSTSKVPRSSVSRKICVPSASRPTADP